MAKTLIVLGVVFVSAGLILSVIGKIPGLGKLPGDIFIRKENFTFYFPLATCLLISVLLSIIFQIWSRK